MNISYKLLIDDREPADLVSLFEEIGFCPNKPNMVIESKRLYNGDFGFYICGEPGDENKDNNASYLLFVVERKTWADLSASISDGRISSQLSHLETIYNENPSLHIFILMEGTELAYHKATSRNRYPSKPFDHLERKITSIMFKYPFVRFIYSKDKVGTVSKILELADMINPPENKLFVGGNALTKKITSKYLDIQKCFIKLSGVNVNSAKVIMNNFRPFEFFEINDPLILANLKYPSGKSFGESRGKKLYKTMKSSTGMIKFLSGINGITLDTAKAIQKTMKQVIPSLWSEGTLSCVIKVNGRKVGKAVAARLFTVWIGEY